MTLALPSVTLPLNQPVAIFMLVLVIILGSPILFRRLKIPSLVGLIVAGIIVGPYGFNILARDASFEIFGQMGILYLMFLASVEMDMYHLKKNIGKGLVFGLITFIIPLVGGIFASRYALSTGWTTAVLLASTLSSHTLVSYPIISKLGLSNCRGVVIAVSGTIVTVLLSLIVLAEVIDVSVRGYFEIESLLLMFAMMGVLAGAIGWAYPRLTRWFFRKTDDTVSQFIFILVLVCLASLSAKLIGLESILGAFYAGLILNKFIPARSALMGRIEFVGNAIFIPYFMIGVGMLLNIHVVFRDFGVAWIALVMVVTALTTKLLAAWITRRIYSLDNLDMGLMFGLSSGKAAATIAAAMIGYQYGLLDEDLMSGAVVMILVCCIVASVVTLSAARKQRIRLTAGEMEREGVESTGYARQLIAVANPMTSEGLMKLAVFMRNKDNKDPMTVLFVRNTNDGRVIAMGREAIRLASSAAVAMNMKVHEVERYDFNAVSGVINILNEYRATDIIIGLHRKTNIVDTFYGNFIESLQNATDKMIIISRCFVPVDTLRRLVVVVPRNAEYETGFHAWVARVGNLGIQLGSKIMFLAGTKSAAIIEHVMTEDGYGVERVYRTMDTWDDFILASGEIGEEDLLLIIAARKDSVSYSAELQELPGFLNRHFAPNNLVVIYPEQFGDQKR